ncbi:MAG: NERD domain-containing protein [Chloroflexota bacterium]
MAKSYPEHFPEWALSDPKRGAERKIFDQLKKLPASYTFFYSVGWQVRDTKSGAHDGEADFILAHPEFGVMILEVKGGQIRYDAERDEWFSKDRNGVEHAIKDPVEQARNSKGALLSKLKELPGWDQRYLNLAYLIVFPDVVVGHTRLPLDLPRPLVMDANDLTAPEPKLKAAFEWFVGKEQKSGALGHDRLFLLENLLGKSFTLHTPLGVELENEDQRLIELTQEQMKVLHFIQTHRKALIEGCAGSGKTTLALEKSRHLATQGFEVLLLSFNATLADYLRQRAPNGVDVFHFHGLCTQLARRAGLGYRASRTEQEYFDHVLPDMLLESLLELGPQYDAVIVDEGQDFRDEWWEILVELLRDKENGIFYVFFDNNQNIYRRHASLERLITSPPFTLNQNCRNTRSIHEVVRQFHPTPHLLTSQAPQGREPEIYYFTSEFEQEGLLKRILHRLVNEESVQASHITLLTTLNPERTVCHPGRNLGNFVLTEWGDTSLRKTDIRVSSVHRFKGLENRVVLLTGLEDNDPSWLSSLLYVACSRARTHLIVVAHERSKPYLQSILSLQRG